MTRALLVACLLFPVAAAAERRVALLIGENAGESTDVPLRFALQDVERMRSALVEVGGVRTDDVTVLRGATAGVLRTVLKTLENRLVRDGFGPRDRALVYVSSHARDGELRLSGTRLPIAELRRAIDAWPVGVAVLVLDTCDAGAALRSKGLELVSGAATVDGPKLTGRVVIAAAAAGEQALESDAIAGSHFTQHFVAGLRGAADATHDGRVTLEEAYGYARARTVESALGTAGGKQTPVFDVALAGEGDLVLSEPSSARGRLRVSVEAPGDWAVSSADGSAVFRFTKGPGTAEFALDPGTWRVRARVGDSQREGEVEVREGAVSTLTQEALESWPLAKAGRKGSGDVREVGLGAALGNAVIPGISAMVGWQLSARWLFDAPAGEWQPVVGFRVAHRVGNAVGVGFVQREVDVLAEFGFGQRLGAFEWLAALDVGARVAHQEGLAGGDRLGTAPSTGLGVQVSWIPGSAWQLDAGVGGGLLVVRDVTGWTPTPYVVVSAGASARF